MLPGSTVRMGSENCYFCSYLNICDMWSDEETVTENKFEAKIDVFIEASTWNFILVFVTFIYFVRVCVSRV